MSPRRLIVLISFALLGIAGLSFTGKKLARTSIFLAVTDTVKACGTSTILTAATVTGYSNPTWNDGSTGTTLTVNTAGDYWWQATGTTAVTNGNFSASKNNANTRGFTSSYTYQAAGDACPGCCCGVLSPESTYAIDTNPSNVHGNFASIGDHTSGTGQMLIVNGSATANTVVWKQNVPVQPNTDYVFSAWATSVNSQNPAQLQFSIDGVPLGSTINPTSTVGNWQYFTTTWNSGSKSGSLPIALINQNIQASGNDFAVDDIVFAPVYRKNIHVIFNPIPVLTLTGPHITCAAYNLTNAIVGYDTNTYTYVFKDSNGNVITNVNAQAITQSGNYTITEQNKITGCISLPVQTSVTINPNPPKPNISSL